MSTTQQSKPNTNTTAHPRKTSALDRFSLGFEYNETLQDIKRKIRQRTI